MILKIIGIVLASILGLAVILVLLALLSPVFYRGRIIYDEKPDITLRASYLLHIVTVHFDLRNGVSDFALKIFGHKLGGTKKDKPQTKRKKKNTKDSDSSESERVKEKADKESGTRNAIPEEEKTDKKDGNTGRQALASGNSADDTESLPEGKKSIFKKIKDVYNKIIDKIKAVFNKIVTTLKNINEKYDKITSEINDPSNRAGVSFALDLIRKLLVHILPRKHRISIVFGTGDPAVTGEITGAIYTLAVFTGLNIEVSTDFENKVFTCNVPFKGRISIIKVLIWAVSAYRNKNLRQLIDKF